MNETQLNVIGMTCGSCVRHINQALCDIEGIEKVDVSLREGKVFVRHQPHLDASVLTGAIEDAGYEAEVAKH
jgi:copper chaperone